MMGKKIKNAIVAASAYDPRQLWKFLKNKDIPRWKKTLIPLAIIWVIIPLDGDWIPVLGWLDDAGILALANWFTKEWVQKMLDQEAAAAKLDQAPPQPEEAAPETLT